MNKQELEALKYVKNTGGGANKDNFIEDWEPIGEELWAALYTDGLVRIDGNGMIYATTAGLLELTRANYS